MTLLYRGRSGLIRWSIKDFTQVRTKSREGNNTGKGMINTGKEQPFQGLDLDCDVAQLKHNIFNEIDMTRFPSNRTHFLAYALQKGLPLPSDHTMARTEAKNQARSGQDKANKVIGRGARRVVPMPSAVRRNFGFSIANKFGVEGELVTKEWPTCDTMKFHPTGKKIEPTGPAPETKTKKKVVAQKKAPNKAFKVRSPQEIALKAARVAWMEKIFSIQKEKEKDRLKKKNKVMEVPATKTVPLYFQKKKASQKGRRQEKHELIKRYKDKLVKIYGMAIFQKGWPVGRKEIREAVGLKEEDPYDALEKFWGIFHYGTPEVTQTPTPKEYVHKDEDFPSLLA